MFTNRYGKFRTEIDEEPLIPEPEPVVSAEDPVPSRQSFLSMLVPECVTNTIGDIRDTASKVREAASTATRALNDARSNVSLIKDLSLFLIDARTVHLDCKYIFDNPDIHFVDKVGRFIFYLNHFSVQFGKAFNFNFDFNDEPFGSEARAQSLVPTLTGLFKKFFEFLGLTDQHFLIFQQFNSLDTFYSKISQRFIYIFILLRHIIEFIAKLLNTPKILEWYDKVTDGGVESVMRKAYTFLHTPEDELLKEPNRTELRKLFTQAEKIAYLAGVGGWRNANYLRKQIEDLAQLQSRLIKIEEDAFGRLTPFCVCIGGESQIGKSQFLIAVQNALIPENIPVSQRVYSRGQTEHYDGYNGHYCIVVDDWASRVDTDYSELLQWVTCQTMVLPMASLDSKDVGKKGQTCQAKLVLLATNTLYPAMSTTMNNGGAVLKRRHVVIEAKKIKGREMKDDFSHLEFFIKEAEYDRNVGGPYTADRILYILQNRFKSHLDQEQLLFQKRKDVALGIQSFSTRV